MKEIYILVVDTINLSKLDFKYLNCLFDKFNSKPINLSKLDFKCDKAKYNCSFSLAINLSKLDFKYY